MSDGQGYIGRSPGDSSVIIASQTFEPTGIQTDFTFASGYDPGYIDVYFNGARLVYANDYTATNGSTVGLTTYANNGDVLELVAYKAFNVASVSEATGNFTVGNQLSVSGLTTAADAFYTGIVTATSFSGDGSSLTGLANTDVINTENINVIGVATVGSAVTINSTGIDAVSGIITAATFKGALTGNVTGNCSGSSGSATGTAGGLTGTPDIAVRNITGVAATFTGVLTYEDVTNVDSVGVVTARGGFEIGAAGVGGTITAVGNAQFTGIVTATQFRGGSAKFTDDGADSPIVSILADNQTPKAFVIGNSSYNASESFGQNFYNNNAGEGYFLHVADGSYQDYHFSLNNGTTNKVCLKFESDDQSVELYNSGSKKFETTETGTITTGISTADGFSVGDNEYISVGVGSDLVAYHDGTHTYITNTSGDLRITDTGGGGLIIGSNSLNLRNSARDENYFVGNNGGSTELYFNNNKKIETLDTGMQVTGVTSTSSLTVGPGVIQEKFYNQGSALTGTYNHDLDSDGMVLYAYANASASFILNVRGDASTTLNSLMHIGQTSVFTAYTGSNNTSYYMTDFKIDGASQTEKWNGGSAPTAGTGSGVDVYTFNILKTADATFAVFATFSNFA